MSQAAAKIAAKPPAFVSVLFVVELLPLNAFPILPCSQGFLRDFSPSEATQKVDYREHSFFNNPRMDATVNSSRAVIVMCAPGDASCSDGSTPSPIKVCKTSPHTHTHLALR